MLGRLLILFISAVALAIVALLAAQSADIKRYLRMRAMSLE